MTEVCERTPRFHSRLPGNLCRQWKCEYCVADQSRIKSTTEPATPHEFDAGRVGERQGAILSIARRICRRVLTDDSLTRRETKRNAVAVRRQAVIRGQGEYQSNISKLEWPGAADLYAAAKPCPRAPLELPQDRLCLAPLAGWTRRIFAARTMRRIGALRGAAASPAWRCELD